MKLPASHTLPSAAPPNFRQSLGELAAPAPDRFVGNLHAAFGQHQLDVPQAQAEGMVQPDGVADDLGREAVTMVRVRDAFHPATMPHPNTSRQPTKVM